MNVNKRKPFPLGEVTPEEPVLTDFEAVAEFHRKFDLPVTAAGTQPALVPTAVAGFRWRFLYEELSELMMAMDHHNLPGIADALVDLVYVALGTAHYYGLPWPELFAEVQRANMAKERAQSDGSNSKRGTPLDVVKPEGWRPPDLARILAEHGWARS